MTWASALFLLGLAGFVVVGLGLLWLGRSIERRLDRVIELLERDQESSTARGEMSRGP